MSFDIHQPELHQHLISNATDDELAKSEDENQFKANYIDVIIATLIALGLPISCRLIQQEIGALIPLLMYYGCCIFIVRIRRGTFTYNIPKNNKYYWICSLFIPLLIIVAAQQVIVYNIVIVSEHHGYDWLGTLLIWCPLNASLEQLLWMYIYDAFACIYIERFNESKLVKYTLNIIGLIMSLAFVGMIHALFWTNFLMEFDQNQSPWYQIFLGIKFLTIFGYIVIFKITDSATPLFLLHIITDANSVIAAKYSILPFLWTR